MQVNIGVILLMLTLAAIHMYYAVHIVPQCHSLLEGTSCSYPTYTSCNDSDWDDYSDCVYQCGCEKLLSPLFLSQLPEVLWVAIRPFGLQYHSVDDEEFEDYRKFQSCQGRCEDVCEAALEENDRECVENCILTFCV